MERVINIIGMGASATSVPDTGERWGLSQAYKHCKLDRLIIMDNWLHIIAADPDFPPVERTFATMCEENPNIELIGKFNETLMKPDGKILGRVKEYPLNDVLKLAPGAYFTSSIAYAICLAILEKVDRIRLYGLELWAGSDVNEYTVQAPCVEFWLAFAMGRGIKVEIPYYLMHTAKNTQNYYGYFKDELVQNYKR
jgi:hypothetical protein